MNGYDDDDEIPGSPEIPMQNVNVSLGDDSEEELDTENVFTTPLSGRSRPMQRMTNATPPGSSIDTSNDISSLAKTLKETNNLLSKISSRVDIVDKKISDLEEKVDTSSSFSTPSRNRKQQVPTEVWRETRRVYSMLLEEDDAFDGWSIGDGFSYKSAENQKILSRLIDEVKGLNSQFITQHIRDAAYRYYRSKCEENSASKRGLSAKNQKKRRRHERIARKVAERTSALKKLKFKKDTDADLWKKVVVPELISSEESDMDEEEEVLKVHSIPWRAHKVTAMFERLNSEAYKSKTPQSKRQRKRRVTGESSQRQRPADLNLPNWIFC